MNDDRLEGTRTGRERPGRAREEAELYADLSDSLRTWARSYHAGPQAREADQADPEAGA